MSDVADDASAKVSDTAAKASDAADAFSSQAKDAMSGAKDAADDGVSYVKARYREHPGRMIAVCVAVVIGIVLVIKAISRRRR